MFGYGLGELAYEGYIDADGKFEIVGSFQGKRYIIILGFDDTPLSIHAYNVTVGGENNVGEMRIGGPCRE